ncbi:MULTISPECIES: class I SAM-dependent methyltransferase [unclassified Sphingobacterium]|uniref:class I SAM-dependent methyltransferase n=1 Tax=unclassified Sphingobacterium TaxID=2609468 RepID=UPI0025DEA485|nr:MULTISPECIES: class I SAM-dependent methyltransferase [unclassified Sphingobacterium]
MNYNILQKEVQHFLQDNSKVSPSAIALKKSPFVAVSSAELATQLDGRQRIARKLPKWANTPGIYFPEKLNLEQSSSEQTAAFKCRLIKPDTALLDMTGGFGIDSYFFASKARQVTYCEINTALSEIVQHNFQTLGVNNVKFVATDAVTYLEQQPDNSLDYIYIDPSRRVNTRKVFLLTDCEPNIADLQTLFFTKANTIISKIAPLMDISTALTSLQYVKDVYVISVDNDCKELLFVQEKGFEGEPEIHSVRLFQGTEQQLTFTYEQERQETNNYSTALTYLYDPDVAITKAGAFKTVGKQYQLQKLHSSTHLYTSTELETSFPGRMFSVTNVLPYSAFKKADYPKQANIIAKNFPDKPEELRKRWKIKDGGEQFLFFTQDHDNNYIVIMASRLH